MELKVSDLACARGGMRVLDGVSFTVAEGEALVLRGPNGSGKTTLLRTLAGLQAAQKGRIQVPPDTIAYAGHADGIKPTLTVAENLQFWAAVYGAGDIMDAVEQFALAPLAGRAAQNLSAGQKRRLGLARLLVTGRPIWMLDEPTVSLDQEAVGMFASAVQAHLASGGLAVLATHIDLGLPDATNLDLDPFRPEETFDVRTPEVFDEAVE